MQQNRRQFLIAGAMTVGCLRFAQAQPVKKPNIVFILADDLGYADLGCYGQQHIKTPNLDRMAAEGVRFTQHYAGSTVCAPSRCTLMTGKHTGHCSVRGNVDVVMEDSEATVAKVLREAGYATACIGKWGVGNPQTPDDVSRNGFDYFYGYLSMWHAHNSYPEFLWRNTERVPLRNVVQRPEKYYKADQAELVGAATERVDFSQDLCTDEALAFIDGHREKPFFLYLPYTIPHANNEANGLGAIGIETPTLEPYENEDWPEVEKAKAAAITRLDSYVGRIVERLKQHGIDRNTVVFFSSDNGPHHEGGVDPEILDSNGPLQGTKRDLYEGGIRTPFLAYWPGTIAAGSTSDHISAFWDLLPTLADLADAPIPEGTDGISMVPTLLGKGRQRKHDYLYWEFHEGNSKQAVRMGKWKAIQLAPSEPIALYNLDRDLGETKNLAAEHPEIVARAEAIFREARTNAEDWPLVEKRAAGR